MSFKYDCTSLFDCKTNQTKGHTGWSSRSVVGSWVTSDHLSAPGCSGSRVCCYKIHPWNIHSKEWIIQESQKFGQLPWLPLGLFSLQSLQHHGAALPRPCTGMSLPRGPALAVPALSPCVLVALSSLKTCAPELPFPCLGSGCTGPQWAWGMCPPSVTDSSQPNLLERCQWRSSHRLVSQEQKATTWYFYTISLIYPHFYFDLLLSLTVIMSHVAEQ